MNQKSLMPIREFSLMSGIRRENLRFYDKIGLLSPEMRGDNGYRYYTRRQLDMAFLITDLRALGVGLEEIQRYAAERSPEGMLALFQEQDAHIEAEIARLRSIQELMRLRTDMATQAMQYAENTVVLEVKGREPIFLCPALGQGCSEEEGMILAYDQAAVQAVDTSYPLGSVVTRADFESGNYTRVARYYFKVHRHHNAWKPAGTYAVFYGHWDENKPEGLYTQLIDFIRDRGLHVAGDAYEETPLDELSTRAGEQHGMRVEVRVTKGRGT